MTTFADAAHLVVEELETMEGILTESFLLRLDDKTVAVSILFLNRSCFIWIGSSDSAPAIGSLITSLPTKFDAMPLSTTLLDEGNDLAMANGVAVRLSKKFNIQTFVSCNLPSSFDDSQLFPALEKKLIQTLAPHYTKA